MSQETQRRRPRDAKRIDAFECRRERNADRRVTRRISKHDRQTGTTRSSNRMASPGAGYAGAAEQQVAQLRRIFSARTARLWRTSQRRTPRRLRKRENYTAEHGAHRVAAHARRA